MKKTLFLSAILGAALCSSAMAAVSYNQTISTSDTLALGETITWATGTTNERLLLTIDLTKLGEVSADQHINLFTVNGNDTDWGLRAINGGKVTGVWVTSDWGSTVNYKTLQDLAQSGATSINVVATVGRGGTYMRSMNGDDLYTNSGLKTDKGTMASYKLDGTGIVTSAGHVAAATITDISGDGTMNLIADSSINGGDDGSGVTMEMNGYAAVFTGNTTLKSIGAGTAAKGAGITVKEGITLTSSIKSSWCQGAITLEDNASIVATSIELSTGNSGTNVFSGDNGKVTTGTLKTSNVASVTTSVGTFTITGDATLGGSNLTIAGGAFSVKGNTQTGGTVAITGGSTTLNTVSGNGTINVTGNATLAINGNISGSATINGNGNNTTLGAITITGGTFQNVTFNNSKVAGSITLNGLTGTAGALQAMLAQLSQKEGVKSTIQLGGNGDFTITETDFVTGGWNLTFLGQARINGHGYDQGTDKNGRAFNIQAGDTVTANQGLVLESKATLNVQGGTLNITDSLTLGHTQGAAYVGHVNLESGSMTVGTIAQTTPSGQNSSPFSTANTFTMTGGTLTFTKPASVTTTPAEGDPVTTTYNAIDGVTATITGGTLSTAEAAWKIDNANVTLSGVTISGANAATLSHVKLGNTTTKIHTNTTVDGGITSVSSSTDKYAFLVENNSTLTLTGADYDLTNAGAGIGLQSGSELVVDTDANLTIKTFVYSSSAASSNGKLTVKEDGSVNVLGGGFRDAFLKDIVLDGSLTVAQGAQLTTNVLTGGTNSELTVNGTVNINEASTIAALSGTGSLKLSSNLTVTNNTTTIGSLTLSNGADITVNNHDGSLTTSTLTVAGAGSAVNANLIVSAHGTLDFSAGHALTMGCSVEIGNNVTVVIDDSIVAGIVNRGETVTIITDAEAITSLDDKTWHFQNAAGQSLAWANLRLEVGADGKSIVVAPEPATATLSLLALAALAARRRRH